MPCNCAAALPEACKKLPNSYCETSTGQCTCFPQFKASKNGKTCRSVGGKTRLFSDGSKVSPFSNAEKAEVKFQSVNGTDPAKKNQFDLKKNGYYLEAYGKVS